MILQAKLLALVNEILSQNAKLRKGGSQATYFCPFCNHYKRKLEVNLDYGQWHCWVCHTKGSYLGSLLTKVKAPQHYRDRLYDLTKDVRINRRIRPAEIKELTLPEDFISLATPPIYDPLHPDIKRQYNYAINYLKKRGIGIEDICRYNIGHCIAGEYKDCVIVPSYDEDGKLNYFSSRYIYPHKWFKYKNAPFSKNIIGFECFINFEEPVTLVEGVFDAIAVRKNAIPLFGTMMSRHLLEALVMNKTPRINLVLDNDAIKESTKAVRELWKWGLTVHLIELKEKDPSEMGFHKIHDLIENSKPYTFQNLIYHRLME